MNRLLFLILLLCSFSVAQSQTGFLFVKAGIKKKKIYTEGDRIMLQLYNDDVYYGIITLLKNDTIYVSGRPVPRKEVKAVILAEKKKKSPITVNDFLLATGGAALVTTGITLSKQADFNEALVAGIVIGYSQLALRYLTSKISLKRKKYPIGKRFYLQVLDFHLPPRKAF